MPGFAMRRRAARPALILTFVLIAAMFPPPSAQDSDPILAMSVADVIEMIGAGISEEDILAAFRGLPPLALSLDDIGRLKKAGASDRLIRELSSLPGEREPEPATPPSAAPTPGADAGRAVDQPVARRGTLRLGKVLWWDRRGVPAEEIAARIDEKGLKHPVEFDALFDAIETGRSPDVARLIAQGRSALPSRLAAIRRTPGAVAAPPPLEVAGDGAAGLTPAEVLEMLQEGRTPAAVTGSVIARGMAADMHAGEEAALRAAGATDGLISLMRASAATRAREADPAPAPPVAADAAPPAMEAPDDRRGRRRLPPLRRDSLLVTSLPSGAGVYIAPASAARAEIFSKPYLAGRTPLHVPVAPGRYTVAVRKAPGNFETELLPAWRTVHDLASRRVVLDNADLTFDPDACCLPGSLDGGVDLRPLDPTRSGLPLGDRFDGFPPYLFDGEALQIVSVARGAVVATAKLYEVEKGTENPALVVATFLPADSDPLDLDLLGEDVPGTVFDPLLDTPALSFLSDAAQIGSLATAIDVEPAEAEDAAAMLRRAGKAIIVARGEASRRFVVLSVEGQDRIRLADRTITPHDPFAAPEPARSRGKKKKKAAAPPPPPPLPDMQRVVVPGLGRPRLLVNNTRPEDTLLLFDDGQLFFVPANTEREFVLSPGTYRVRLAGPGLTAPQPEGALHFSYQARYTLTI